MDGERERKVKEGILTEKAAELDEEVKELKQR